LKYKRKEGWVARRAAIITKAEAKADEQQVTLLTQNMHIVKVAKQKLFDQIEARGKNKSKTPYSDIDRIIRLEEFLQGRPDSRPQIDYADYTEEQLSVELQLTIEELIKIPECRRELQKLLNSETS